MTRELDGVELGQRVARGMAILDAHWPGWTEQINLDTLDLNTGWASADNGSADCGCTLAQLDLAWHRRDEQLRPRPMYWASNSEGEYGCGLAHVLGRRTQPGPYDEEATDWAIDHGFNNPRDLGPDSEQAWDDLTEEWRRVISARRAGAGAP